MSTSLGILPGGSGGPGAPGRAIISIWRCKLDLFKKGIKDGVTVEPTLIRRLGIIETYLDVRILMWSSCFSRATVFVNEKKDSCTMRWRVSSRAGRRVRGMHRRRHIRAFSVAVDEPDSERGLVSRNCHKSKFVEIW